MTYELTFFVNKGDYTSVELHISSIEEPIPIQWNINDYCGIFHEDVYIHDGDIPETIAIKRPVGLVLKERRKTLLAGELQLVSTYVLKSATSTPVYLFRPLDYHYPSFYVHSNLKKKYNGNVWISIAIAEWKANAKFPDGTTKECFGAVGDYVAMEMALFVHFELFRKAFKIPTDLGISFDKERTVIKGDIISIDPQGCTDIDDAFTFDGDTLWIHISDVFCNCRWFPTSLEELCSQLPRSTSVYMKETIIPMLPKEWSSGKASLLQGERRHMLTLEIKKSSTGYDYQFYPSTGKIKRNYSYEEFALTPILRQFTQDAYDAMSTRFKSSTEDLRDFKVADTHTLIEAMMIMYNLYFGNYFKNVLVRTQQSSGAKLDETVNERIRQYLWITKMNKANYEWKNAQVEQAHSTLGLCYYTHATSPIRRMADLVNQYMFYQSGNIVNICNEMNVYEKKLRMYYRKRNVIYLAEKMYKMKDTRKVSIYITSINILKNRMSIYFPDENLSVRVPIVPSKLLDIRKIGADDKILSITDKHTGEIQTIPIGEEVLATVSGRPNLFAIDDSLKIKLSIEEK
jgi:exoribonuclease R